MELQRARATKKKFGRAWRALSKKIKRLPAKAAHLVDNGARPTAKQLVEAPAVFVAEDLHLKNMTRSAKGTVEEPGRNVAAKAGLNRSLSQAAPGKLAQGVYVKAETLDGAPGQSTRPTPHSNAPPTESPDRVTRTLAGGNGAISTGLRSVARDWSRAIYRHYTGSKAVDGIFSTCSHLPPARNIVLFERAADALPSRPGLHLPLAHPALRAELEHYAHQLGLELLV